MTELEATGLELEKLYRCALGLTALLEDLTPGDAVPERQWFLVHQLLQELTDSADSARAGLVLATLRLPRPMSVVTPEVRLHLESHRWPG
jgi:hypothetical protein